MRKLLILAVLLGGIAATPLAAQSEGIAGRVGKLEREMRAVQRKVFPGGNAELFEPEITQQTDPSAIRGTPASLPLSDLTARVDSLEAQLANLTNQSEQNAFRLRQLEEQVARLAADTEALRAPPPAAAPPPSDDEEPAADPVVDDERRAAINAVIRPVTGDDADDLYVHGYRLWEAKLYPEAQAELRAVVERFPDHRRASWAQNLLGRAYLDEGKPALASVAFYENYQKMPRGERAPDSLVYLGQALIQLDKAEDACKVYDVLDDEYSSGLSIQLRAMATAGREEANCG